MGFLFRHLPHTIPALPSETLFLSLAKSDPERPEPKSFSGASASLLIDTHKLLSTGCCHLEIFLQAMLWAHVASIPVPPSECSGATSLHVLPSPSLSEPRFFATQDPHVLSFLPDKKVSPPSSFRKLLLWFKPCPPNVYTEALTRNTPECDFIWKQGQYRVISQDEVIRLVSL